MKAKTLEQVQGIVKNIEFMDRKFVVVERGDGFLLQVQYIEPDIDTGRPELQKARKWFVSRFSTETEIVETAFKACRVSMDHVLKEHFLYEGHRVYSPHFNIRARIAMAERHDYDGRDSPTSLEVMPDGEVRRADKPIGRVWLKLGTWAAQHYGSKTEISNQSSRSSAAQWVLATDKEW